MVSGVPPQSFREDSLVNERVNMPECRYAMFVQICMGEHGSSIHYYSCFAAFIIVCTVACGRMISAPTDKQQLSYIKNSREDDVLHFANRLPDIHFTFSIFHFQFKIFVRASLFSPLRNYLLKSTAAVYCTVTVIVTELVLLSTSVTEYVTLYLPFRVVTTLPKTSIFEVMSLPQVSTAVIPARA